MNRPIFRTIGRTAAIAAISAILAVATVQAQQLSDVQQLPSPAAKSPPPNPLPPPSGNVSAVPGAAANSPAEPGFLGVIADDRQEKGAGVRIVELEAGGPAEHGGLKPGDLITSVNGTPVHSENDMIAVLQKLGPRSVVKFVVDRAGQRQTIQVTLGTRPPAGQRKYQKFGQIPESLPEPAPGGGLGPETPGAQVPGSGAANGEPGRIPADAVPNGAPVPGAPNSPFAPNAPPGLPGADSGPQLGTRILPPVELSHRPLLGVRTRPVTEEVRQRLRLPTTQGALVVARTVGSPAALAGIPLDAVILAVDGKPVDSPLDLTALVAQAGPGREVEITYIDKGSQRRVKVKLAEFALGPSSLPGGGTISVGPVPPPPAPQAGHLPAPDDKTRIDALERRVQQLEHRVDDLEAALRRLK